MTTARNTSLLLIVLLLVGGTIAALFLLSSNDAGPEGKQAVGPLTPGASAREEAPKAAPIVVQRSQGERADASLSGLAGLQVEVYTRGAQPLHAALSTATPIDAGPEAAPPRPKLSPARWEDLAVGRWKLVVSCDGHVAQELEVELEPNIEKHVRVELVPHGSISGTVSSASGRPLSAVSIWFLREGQEHPASSIAGREYDSVKSDRYGRFSHTFEGEGTLRVTVGAPGEPRLSHPGTIPIGPGVERELSVVLGDGAQIEFQVSGMPSKETQVIAMIERKVGTSRPSGRPKGQPARGAKGKEASGAEDSGDALAPSLPVEPIAADGGPIGGVGDEGVSARWMVAQRGYLNEDGTLSLSSSLDGQGFRVVLQVGRQRYESDALFEIRPGLQTSIFTSLPPGAGQTDPLGGGGRASAGRGAGDTRPPGTKPPPPPAPKIAVQVSVGPIVGSDRPVGLHWK